MKRSILAIIIILSAFSNIKLNAQPIESPLEPIYYKYHDFELRGLIGLGVNFNSGSYWAECPECQFENLSGFGFTIGPEPEYAILPNYLYVGMKILYDMQNMSSSFRRIESVPLMLADNSEISTPIEFRHTLDLSMQAISFSPNIFFRIADMFDIRLGFYGDFLISNNVKHTKELLTHNTILPNGESMVFGIAPEVNFNILLSKDWEFIIGTYFKIPFSGISDNQSDFKTNMWRFYLGVSYNLTTDKY